MRLYFEITKKKKFKFVYNNYTYNNYYRTLDYVKIACYFLKIRNKIYAYINR
jgi:hypothetical protein